MCVFVHSCLSLLRLHTISNAKIMWKQIRSVIVNDESGRKESVKNVERGHGLFRYDPAGLPRRNL